MRTICARFIPVIALIFLSPVAVLAQAPSPSTQIQGPGSKLKSPAPSDPAASGTRIGPATPSGGPDMVSETYGDWIMRCQPAGSAKRCELSQTIVLQGQTAPIALIGFGHEKKSDPIRIIVQLPTNITFDGGVKALSNNGEILVDLQFRRCFPSGCFADSALTDATITKLQAQTQPMNIKFRDGTGREIVLPLSVKGFGPAMDALSRS